MKTIYLEIDAEITDVVDKLRQTQTDQIILVVPKGASLLQSIVNLKLLKKEAESLGKTISLVTTDPIGKNLAQKVGLLAHQKRPKAHEAKIIKPEEKIISKRKIEEEPRPSRTPEIIKKVIEKERSQKTKKRRIILPKKEKKPSELESPRQAAFTKPSLSSRHVPILSKAVAKRIVLFLTTSIGIFAIILFLLLPSAKIRITPKTEPLLESFNVTANTKVQSINERINEISGQIVSQELEQTQTNISATGVKKTGEKARGTVTIYNEYSSDPQVIASGTGISAQGITFILTNQVTVPEAQILEGDITPGSVQVEAIAGEVGEEYNIGPTRFSILGISSKIYAESSSRMDGGTSKEITVVSEQDIDKAKESISKELYDKVLKKLKSETEKEDTLFDQAVKKQILNVASSIQAGGEVSHFDLTIKIRVSSIKFNKSEANELIIALINSQIPKDKKLDEEHINLDFQKPLLHLERNILQFEAKVKGNLFYKVDLNALKKEVIGKSLKQAEDYLDSQVEINDAQIILWPFWVKSIPKLEKKIRINLTLPENFDNIIK